MGQETGKPLSKEDSVQELLGILVQFQEKRLFDSLMETVNHVQDMEHTVAKMEDQIKDMNRELSEVKKQNEHLVKKADETVRDRLAERVAEAEKKVAYVKMKLSGFKEKIREKCRQVVSGVKAQGKRALNGMAGFLHLREGVERLKDVTEKMAGSLDALSESVEKEREISMQGNVERTVKAGPAQKPHLTSWGRWWLRIRATDPVGMLLMRSWHTGREKAQRNRPGRQEGQPCSSRLSRQQGRQDRAWQPGRKIRERTVWQKAERR